MGPVGFGFNYEEDCSLVRACRDGDLEEFKKVYKRREPHIRFGKDFSFPEDLKSGLNKAIENNHYDIVRYIFNTFGVKTFVDIYKNDSGEDEFHPKLQELIKTLRNERDANKIDDDTYHGILNEIKLTYPYIDCNL